MAPPRLKLEKKKQGSATLVNANDYLESADSHEEAMGKHRVGDPAKALRFADRALDVYTQGLAKFPRNFDLAYNKARLELKKATDLMLSQALEVSTISVLRHALSSHYYARDLAPTHPDTLFNTAQVLTSIAEIIAKDDDADDSEAVQNLEQALEMQSCCFELQQAAFTKNRLELEEAMRETAQYMAPQQTDNGQATTNPTTESQDNNLEEQWVMIEEPITATTLLDTIIAQVETLTALCSILSASLDSPPDPEHKSAAALSWVKSYSTNLLTQILPALINENWDVLEPRLIDVMLPRAVFMSHYLDLSFRLSAIDVEAYKQELDAAFSQPGLDAASEGVLLASTTALLSLNSTLADAMSGGMADDIIASYAALRWKILVAAQSRLSSVANIPGTDQLTVATTHSVRGDISLFLQVLAYPPTSYPQARNTTPQLLKHAEVYYRNASKLLGSIGRHTDEEKAICELKGAVVSVLQQTTTDQTVAGSSSGQDNSGTMPGVSASTAQIKLSLESVVGVHGAEWVSNHIEDMMYEGMIAPEVFAAITQG
ncbi:hypothetical protein SAMD00023353_3700830 [Rosellinia necatrix]|uniref:Uncharacterized protein n=1 Tax=Rosellinia necatrix TaxID=77044 RepID=A0A1W2TLZ6_ROSNE|nr:hypothetical protein SAMD00023353_3700830 [Rosellinia necatrix]